MSLDRLKKIDQLADELRALSPQDLEDLQRKLGADGHEIARALGYDEFADDDGDYE